MVDSNVNARTQFLDASKERYAFRRFGKRSERPLLFLQHFTGTLDNWDPAVTDRLADALASHYSAPEIALIRTAAPLIERLADLI